MLVMLWFAEVEEYCRQKQGPYMEDKVSSTCKVELADTRESTVSGNSMKDRVKMWMKFWEIGADDRFMVSWVNSECQEDYSFFTALKFWMLGTNSFRQLYLNKICKTLSKKRCQLIQRNYFPTCPPPHSPPHP